MVSHLSLSLSVSLPLSLSVSVCLSVSVSLSVSLYVSLSLSLSMSVSVSVYQSVSVCLCLSLCLSLSLSLSLSLCLSLSLSLCLSLSLSLVMVTGNTYLAGVDHTDTLNQDAQKALDFFILPEHARKVGALSHDVQLMLALGEDVFQSRDICKWVQPKHSCAAEQEKQTIPAVLKHLEHVAFMERRSSDAREFAFGT